MKIDKNVPLPVTPLNSIVGTLKRMSVGDSRSEEHTSELQ